MTEPRYWFLNKPGDGPVTRTLLTTWHRALGLSGRVVATSTSRTSCPVILSREDSHE